MAPSILIRANGKMFTRNSTAIRVNGTIRIDAVDSIDWSDERSSTLVPSGADHGKPQARGLGDYSCAATIGIYADAASQFEHAILNGSADPTAETSTIRNLTRSPFSLSIAMREEMRMRIVSLEDVVIVGRPSRTIGNDGNAIVKQYALQPMCVVEDGKSLVDITSTSALNEDPHHDFIVVRGVRSPGKATITGLRIAYNWDIQEGYGIDAAIMIYRGRKLMRFTTTFTLVGQEQYSAWLSFSKYLEPSGSPNLGATVNMWSHPILAAAGLGAATLLDRGMPERQTDGTWKVVCECIEWRKPRDVLVKPKTIADADKGTRIPPATAGDRALAKAQNDVAKQHFRASRQAGPPPLPVPEE